MAGDSLGLVEQLLAAQSGGEEARAGMMSLLTEHEDPRVRLISQILSQRQAEAAQEQEEADEEPAPAAASEHLRTELRLRRKIQALLREIERLRETNDALAAALGACPLCWGDDPDCLECEGQGDPGSARPDRELFGRLVAPALQRFKTTARRSGGLIPNPSPTDFQADSERRLA